GNKEAGPGSNRKRGAASGAVLGHPALARRNANQLPDDAEPNQAPRRARDAEGGGRLRATSKEGSQLARRRDRPAEPTARRHQDDASASDRPVRDRPAQGAARGG